MEKKFKKAMWPKEHLTTLIHQSDNALAWCQRHGKDLPARNVATAEHACELPNILFMLHQTFHNNNNHDLRRDGEHLCASLELWQNLICNWEGQEIQWRLWHGDVLSLLILEDGLVDAGSLRHPALRGIWNAVGDQSKINLAGLIGLVLHLVKAETFGLFQGLGQVAAQHLTEQWDHCTNDVLKANVPWFRFNPWPNNVVHIFLVALPFFQHPNFMPDR